MVQGITVVGEFDCCRAPTMSSSGGMALLASSTPTCNSFRLQMGKYGVTVVSVVAEAIETPSNALVVVPTRSLLHRDGVGTCVLAG